MGLDSGRFTQGWGGFAVDDGVFLGVVACTAVCASSGGVWAVDEFWVIGGTDVGGDGAAGVESAAAGWVRGGGDIAGEDDLVS